MAGALVVDTSALMAVLLEEPDALRYAQALRDADELRMSAPTWLEAAQVATGRRGVRGYEQFDALVSLLDIDIVPCDADLARLAYGAWLRFGKGRHPAGLNFGDCFSYALAKLRDEPLLFKGEDFSKTDLTAAL
jgi:ribonuclease VapC